MFTSEPSLAQRIERMIGDAPIVDAHSHIRCDQPGAPDLAALIGDRSIRSGLVAVGMPHKDLDPTLPPDERVRRSIPYLKRMRNTSAAWCLFRIFRDLYDFDEPNLTDSNFGELFDKVAKTGRDPDWARSVLRDRAKIRLVVTALDNRSADPSRNPDHFYYSLDLGDLLCPGIETPNASRTTKGEYFEALGRLLGARPTSTDRLERLVFEWLDRTVTGRVRFSRSFLPVERRFSAPDEAHTQFVLGQASDDWDISDVEVDRLAQFVSWSVLKWHHENKKAIQLAIGVEFGPDACRSIPRSQETWAVEMVRAFEHFRGARFDVMAASDAIGHDVAVMAGQYPNLYASGPWSHDFCPILIERNFGFRVQVAPMTKIGGFLGDAYNAEWTYGRLQVVRKAMAPALARLVEARFLEEDEVPPLLHQILYQTPRELYDLGEPADG